MWRSATGVAGVAHEPDHITLFDIRAGGHELSIEVRVVVGFPAHRTRDPDNVSAEAVCADRHDDARRGCAHGRSPLGEDVDAVMGAAAAVAVGAEKALNVLRRDRKST